MGDTINLVRKAQEHMDEEDAKKLEQKLRDASFTYEDYLKQIQMVKKMGSLKGLLGMIPGLSQLKELDINEKEFFKIEAMIQSMTPGERREKCEIGHSRRQRIAKGSGTKVPDVDKLVKSFTQAKKFFKNMPSNMKQMQEMMGSKMFGKF
jgi:signal recognition particle subunit SRP54